ncbi:MAG: ABC transporter ATP-binding protein/permease [Candidatus Bathyarchaeota archaeon]|nr:ABC transporter ATP-binding protein/permease [Candidatus Bathyarchaeota archaeon]
MSRGSIGRLFMYMAREKRTLASFLIVSIAGIAAGMLVPWVVRDMVNYIISLIGIGNFNLSIMISYALALIALLVASGFLEFLDRYLSELLSQRVVFRLRIDLYSHLQDLSYGFYDRIDTGQIILRTTGDMDTIGRFIGFSFSRLIHSILTLIIAVTILLTINVELTMIAFIILPVLAVAVIFFNSKIAPILEEQWTVFSRFNTVVKEYIAGMRVVKALGLEPIFRDNYMDKADKVYNLRLSFARFASLMWPSIGLLSGVASVLVYVYGGFRVISHTLSLGDLIAFITYLSMLNRPIVSFGFFILNYKRATVSASKIFEVLDAEPEVKEEFGATELREVKGAIEFRNVSFGYVEGKPVLKNISFKIKPGEKVAIVGGTGSGKSTILKLIPRFYDPWSGQVIVDGVDVRKVKIASLRRHIGIVHQDVFIFSGTIKDNIAYGKPNAKMEEIIEAARIAGIHDFISQLPQGYETSVAERGVTLSGGQRQRIAIARAILMNPKVLLLDDPTSNLDAETEVRVVEALKKLIEGKTAIIVTQRLSTLKLADRILVLDRGEIVEDGTHEELLSMGGVYTRLYTSQFAHQEALLVREV